jgi:hypothetical protein
MDPTSRREFYRAKAAEAEENARLATDPVLRVTYLHVANSWIYLAEHIEELKRNRQRQA